MLAIDNVPGSLLNLALSGNSSWMFVGGPPVPAIGLSGSFECGHELDHEVRDDPVKVKAVVEAIVGGSMKFCAVIGICSR